MSTAGPSELQQRPARRRACAAVAAAGAALVALAAGGCAGGSSEGGSPPRVVKTLGFATDVPEAAPWVTATRPAPGTLDYIPIGAPRAEPPGKPAPKEQVEARMREADALKPSRAAVAAARPKTQAAPALPESALDAKREHDERMRERATPAE
jgi:hypothetical protein